MAGITHKIMALALLGFSAAGSVGGCKCGRDVNVPDEVKIDHPALVTQNPNADRPQIYFPAELMTPDVTLNKFIDEALQICCTGDYDRFRQLFGTAYTPTSEDAFEEVWRAVREIRVAAIKQRRNEAPPVYYLHAVVHLRKPDRQSRTKRNVIVTIFKEGNEWRLGAAPKEVVEAFLAAESQPAVNPSRPAG